jgi:hypothetical protein
MQTLRLLLDMLAISAGLTEAVPVICSSHIPVAFTHVLVKVEVVKHFQAGYPAIRNEAS